MKLSTLLKIQKVLLINWVVAPAFAIYLLIQKGIGSAALFVVLWLILDRVLNLLTDYIQNLATKSSKTNDSRTHEQTIVPSIIAFTMLLDLLLTLLLPVLIGLLMI